MRSRLFAFTGALALALGGLLVSAGPAAADQAHCYGWSHPDLYNSGGIHFLNGTNMHRGPYLDCDVLGAGYPSQGINVHCAVINSNNYVYLYVDDTSTGVSGWARSDALGYDHTVSVPVC